MDGAVQALGSALTSSPALGPICPRPRHHSFLGVEEGQEGAGPSLPGPDFLRAPPSSILLGLLGHTVAESLSLCLSPEPMATWLCLQASGTKDQAKHKSLTTTHLLASQPQLHRLRGSRWLLQVVSVDESHAQTHQEHPTLSICSWGSLEECLFPLSFLDLTTWVRPLLQPSVLSSASPRNQPPPKTPLPRPQLLGIPAQRQGHDPTQFCLVCAVGFSFHSHRTFHGQTPHPVQRVRPRKACWIFNLKVKDKVGHHIFHS